MLLLFRGAHMPTKTRHKISLYVIVLLRGAHALTNNRHTSFRIRRHDIRLERRVSHKISGSINSVSVEQPGGVAAPPSCHFFLYPSPYPSLQELDHPQGCFHVLFSVLTATAVILVAPTQRQSNGLNLVDISVDGRTIHSAKPEEVVEEQLDLCS